MKADSYPPPKKKKQNIKQNIMIYIAGIKQILKENKK